MHCLLKTFPSHFEHETVCGSLQYSLSTVLCWWGFCQRWDLLPTFMAFPIGDGIHLHWGGVHILSRFILAHVCSGYSWNVQKELPLTFNFFWRSAEEKEAFRNTPYDRNICSFPFVNNQKRTFKFLPMLNKGWVNCAHSTNQMNMRWWIKHWERRRVWMITFTRRWK